MFVEIKIMNIWKLKPKCESHGLSCDLRTTSCSSIFSAFQLLKQPTNNTVMSRYVQLQHISHTCVKDITKYMVSPNYTTMVACYAHPNTLLTEFMETEPINQKRIVAKSTCSFCLSSFSLTLNSLSLFFNSWMSEHNIPMDYDTSYNRMLQVWLRREKRRKTSPGYPFITMAIPD